MHLHPEKKDAAIGFIHFVITKPSQIENFKGNAVQYLGVSKKLASEGMMPQAENHHMPFKSNSVLVFVRAKLFKSVCRASPIGNAARCRRISKTLGNSSE